MSSSRIKVAVVGANGYTGEQLMRLLLLHPAAEVVCLTSRAEAGKPLATVMPRFKSVPGVGKLIFQEPKIDEIVASGAQAAFLALPHGVAAEFAQPLVANGLVVIDLSADFRIADPEVYQEFYDHPHPAPDLLKSAVYGMPELHSEAIKHSNLIASPGCYPTSIILPLVPLLRASLLNPNSIQTFSMSGVTGAGKKPTVPLLFCECNESVRAYSVPKHRHLSEIEQELSKAAGEKTTITFTPHLIPVNTGICTTTYAQLKDEVDSKQIGEALQAAYQGCPFVRLLGENSCPDTKNVTSTNFIDIGWAIDHRTRRAILMSVEDNVVKGAGGQAIQSFNLRFGLNETSGLMVI